jgi:hypothetical protein
MAGPHVISAQPRIWSSGKTKQLRYAELHIRERGRRKALTNGKFQHGYITAWAGLPKDGDNVPIQIEQPEFLDIVPRIERRLDLAVESHGRVCLLDDKERIDRTRMPEA